MKLTRTNSVALIVLLIATVVRADLPNPTLTSVFPPGALIGRTTEVTVAGSALEKLTTLRCSLPGVQCESLGKNRFALTIPAKARPGQYDLRAVCRYGLSSPRTFFVSNRAEKLESDFELLKPKVAAKADKHTPAAGKPDDPIQPRTGLDVTINASIEVGGDIDEYQFTAKRDQRVVIECWANRIDSQLRAVLELYDSAGKRLGTNRGYFGIDPLIDFAVPADGEYSIRVYDLTYTGGGNHIYRLDIDTGPRVEFAVPSVIQLGKPARVTLYGRNLRGSSAAQQSPVAATKGSVKNRASIDAPTNNSTPTMIDGFETIEVDIPAVNSFGRPLDSLRLAPAQISVDGFAYHFPGSHRPIMIGLTDVPVVEDATSNQSPSAAQNIAHPCEVSGQLIAGDEQDWYAINAKRGEVLWIETFGARIGSPVDLDVSILDESGKNELARFSDELLNVGGKRFPSSHLDASGRWTVPADGRYLLVVRNLIGGLDRDPRRIYRLSLQREVPDFHLAVVARHAASPAGINVWRGGRELADLLVFRRRGQSGSIRVSARDLPPGIECPDVWFGPGVNRAPLILSAATGAPPFAGSLKLVGTAGVNESAIARSASHSANRTARGGVIVQAGTPTGWGRITADVPLAIAPESPLRLTALTDETRVPQGSVVHIAADAARRNVGHQSEVTLFGVGLPHSIRKQVAKIPAGQNKGYISFGLPANLAPGRYTIAVSGETTVPFPVDVAANKQRPTKLTFFSNAVNFEVYAAPFILEVDTTAPQKVQRGQFIRLNYSARRLNGFLGKIHTKLGAPDKVIGLRARGVTFVGQTGTGTLQIIANDDAPLGRQPFLCLDALGTVEDQPIYHARCFLDLEIVE